MTVHSKMATATIAPVVQALDGIRNFRDLSRYPTSVTGKQVRFGI